MQAPSARPVEVTIIAVLAIIGGIFGILDGLAIIGLGGTGAAVGAASEGISAVIVGLLTLALAIGSLAFGVGAWTLKPWAWTLGVAVFAGSIVIALISGLLFNNLGGQALSIVIDAIIIYYLFTPPVKAAFGRA
ncbi:MAG: hypothetical protein ABI670_15580 [Chloroflexota bacterium]